MKNTLILAALSVASVAIAPAAQAQSYEEQLAQLTERFKKADANGDGKLTQKEAEDGGITRVAKFYSRLDTDGDGYVSFDQLKERLESRSK